MHGVYIQHNTAPRWAPASTVKVRVLPTVPLAPAIDRSAAVCHLFRVWHRHRRGGDGDGQPPSQGLWALDHAAWDQVALLGTWGRAVTVRILDVCMIDARVIIYTAAAAALLVMMLMKS